MEVWGPLLHGGKLAVFPPHPPSDVEELGAVIARHGVTTLLLTAGLFTQMVEHHLAGLRPLRQVLCGGDVASAPHVRRAVEELRIPVLNCYGPTEVTFVTSFHPVTDASTVGASVPIGRPIGNTEVYVLDASGQPVPPGVIGELFAGGDGLARGYVGQPALTAERFVPHPFSSVPGARLYRTGDLARWRADGMLEFAGRVDAQVKVRGYRIELAEIEAALLRAPGVAEALVLVREDSPGDKRLVAYVTPTEPGSPPSVADLRASLTARLPGFMVPSAFVPLAAFPLTMHGKVDRKALPAPDATSALGGYVAPRTPLEEQLAQVFAEVLGVERVGTEDDFFDLGGHSLLAVRLMARIRERTGLALPVAALFQGSTVARLAALAPARPGTPNLARLDSGTSQRRPLFLVHGGGGALLSYAELVRHLGDERPIHGIFAPGLEGGELPPASMEALARLYVEQVREAQPQGPYLLAGWSLGAMVAYEMARQLESLGERVELLVLLDALAPSGQPRPERSAATRLSAFAQMAGLPLENAPAADVERLGQLQGEALLECITQLVRGLPAAGAMEPEQVGRLFGVYERLTEAHRTYVPSAALSGPAALLLAASTSVAPESADAGWSTWVRGGVTVREVPGDHNSLLKPPNVSVVAAELLALLRALEPSAPPEE
jgi:thioesterase domain-containing protein/acyl carrier protein